MTGELDERDFRILCAIAEHETFSSEDLHEETGIPKSTVHYRIQNMKDEGVIKNELFEFDREKIGIEITLISEVWAEFGEGYHDTVGEKLSEIEGVNQVYFTMGDTDFVAIARLTSRDMVEQLVEDYESIDEIQRTSSKFAISTIKEDISISALGDYSVETLLDSD
ncbi:Lrp/AsnC family transcription regulator (plasmid) [Natronomonas pharaonis DSM 2160]|uniref:Lrp/AsnC family transcription regulator n=1 Tax=Natronomonas pharaonis (strain ATCC 35678 / DSM 2160 / CIP 103997 / JCM 8858 / NBRC 14720 / NCIMB 2260 / Gabara) TaxID=348780 RepID=Q3ILY9_NATPD|nr:Lrp/AsnC family transcriptional regulator [Natronomonas pharaonis]CAI50880.1 Lrp/AsnC family transcription regulator [Natronomonas pharaonis DSM 2160]